MTNIVVVAGGPETKHTELMVTAVGNEKIDHLDIEWTMGPDLPGFQKGAAAITSWDGKKFFTIGGVGEDGQIPMSVIYEFSCFNLVCEWNQNSERLKLTYPRYAAVAMRMPDSLFDRFCEQT